MSLLSTNTIISVPQNAGSAPKPSLIANRVMAMMSLSDLKALMPHMRRCRFQAGDIVQDIYRVPRSIYFLNGGVASRMMRSDARHMQTQLIGSEGMIGLETILGDTVSDGQIVMDTDAGGWEIAPANFMKIYTSSISLQRLITRYLRYSQAELAFHAAFTSGWNLRARLATLLFMVADRMGEDTLKLTHDTMAERLGVRRPSVTMLLHELEGEHAINSRRKHVIIRDREALKASSKGAYGRCEAAYERIMVRQ